MRDLIERLEKAIEPTRALDAEIYVSIFKGAYPDETREQRLARAEKVGPAYTRSIDAALTLVPKAHLWQLKQGFECCAIVWMIEVDYDDKPAPTGYTTTFPALALCIAALKARADHARLPLSSTKGAPWAPTIRSP